MLDADGSIAFCNDYLLRLTGWKAGNLPAGTGSILMVPPDEREKLRAVFAITRVNAVSPRQFESTLLGKEGGRWLIAWETSTLRDSEGRFTGSAGVGRDITHHKAIQEDLGQSQKLEGMRRSVTKIVHYFAGLMTTISGYCAILLQYKPDSDSYLHPLTEIKRAAEEGVALTQQLLAFSCERKLHPTLLDLNSLIEEVGRSIRSLLPDQVTLHIELDPELGVVRADALHFRQVLVNLAMNAMEAMPAGGDMTIRSSNIELDEEYASRLTGIAPEHCGWPSRIPEAG
jgi:two-component system cell cycle sensor histidine kinase/response regulator CckA